MQVCDHGFDLRGLPSTADEFQMKQTQEYTMHHPEFGDIKYTMAGGWPKQLINGILPKNMRFISWKKCGSLLHLHGRVVDDDPKHWMDTYDSICPREAQFGPSFNTLSYGGNLDGCKRKAIEIFKAHTGASKLPFTDKQCGQLYDRFKTCFGFGLKRFK